jgi:hypothetical protein
VWEWNDTEGTWLDGMALLLQCHDLVLTNAMVNQILSQAKFRWLRDSRYGAASLAHVYKANTDPKGHKYKIEEFPAALHTHSSSTIRLAIGTTAAGHRAAFLRIVPPLNRIPSVPAPSLTPGCSCKYL